MSCSCISAYSEVMREGELFFQEYIATDSRDIFMLRLDWTQEGPKSIRLIGRGLSSEFLGG